MGTNALAIRDADVQALVGSKFYKPLANGIQFKTDDKGTLVPVPKADIDALIGSIVVFDQAGGWWIGDTGNVVETLFGADDLNAFAEKIGKDIALVRKYMSVSRSYGWPSQIAEMRHPDTENVTHRHHQLAQGVKDRKQRMKLLDAASKKQMSAADFHELILNLDGKGKDESGPTPERGVFKPVLGIWDPKVESAEQFIQKAIDKVKDEFQYYADPNLAKQRVANEAKKRIIFNKEGAPVKGLTKEQAAELMAQAPSMTAEALKAKVTEIRDAATLTDRITEHVNKQIPIADELSDETKAELQAKRDEIITGSKDFEAAKKAVTEYKAATKLAEKNVTDNEKLASKITDETKRQALLDMATEQKLTPAQFAPIVSEALTAQLLAAETDRIKKKADAAVGLGEKPAGTGVDSSKLAHPKGGKKTGAAKKGASKKR